MVVYSDYSRHRVGWFLGLSGRQLSVLAAAGLPVFGTVSVRAWTAAATLGLVWLVVVLLVVVPVRARTAAGWLAALAGFTAGRLLGWTRWQSHAATGRAAAPDEADLPGVLQPVQVHDGPPHGPGLARVALVQHHAARTWAVTAAITHPGIGMADDRQRARHGTGLAELLDVAGRTELVDEIQILVRTVPDDGAERAHWVQRHRRPGGPDTVRRVNDDLAAALTAASVRTEAFVTLVVGERRIARSARECGGGVDGRARVLYTLMGEIEAQLKTGLGATAVHWLASPELAVAVRTGFAPGDRAGLVDATHAHQHDPGVNAAVPWAMAGPSGADPAVRHYRHDAWASVSATLMLP